MTRKRQPEPKMSIGTPSPKSLTSRAREIAAIEHHQSPSVRKSDRKQARKELTDTDLALSTDEGKSRGRRTTNPQDPYAEAGAETEAILGATEQEQVEEVARSGVEEASHEQMLEARKKEQAEEESDEDIPME